MKNTHTYSGNFVMAKIRTNSFKFLVIALIAVIGLSMTACPNDTSGGDTPTPGDKGPNIFIGTWEGKVTVSNYENMGDIPVEITFNKDGTALLSIIGMEAEGTYDWKGNVVTIYYYEEYFGTCTLNNDELVIQVDNEEFLESFGTVSATLKLKG